MANGNTGAGHAISVLSNVLNSANSERERMAAILERCHSEFAIERQLRAEAEAEVERLRMELDTKNAELSAVKDRNVSLEREVKVMVSAIEVAGEQIRENGKMITDSIDRISSGLPGHVSDIDIAAFPIEEPVRTYVRDPVGDSIEDKFSAIEREIAAAISSRPASAPMRASA